jgi:hypothetical protein
MDWERQFNKCIEQRDAAQSELAALREELAKSRILAAEQGLNLTRVKREFDASQQRLTAAEQRNAALAELLSKGFNCMGQSGGKHRITMDFRSGDECFEAYSALCNLCHCDSLVREPQPTESGASEPRCCDWFPKCVCHEGADGL